MGQGFGTVRDQTFEAPVNFGPSPEHIKQIQEPFERQLAAQNALTDNLTKALLERSPVAAGPGAQQAVGAAVKSIAEGAEAGDNRLENALSLLKENKTAEAAQLLTAVAEDKKTARIAGPEGCGDCLSQPRRHRRAARPESRARGLCQGHGA